MERVSMGFTGRKGKGRREEHDSLAKRKRKEGKRNQERTKENGKRNGEISLALKLGISLVK